MDTIANVEKLLDVAIHAADADDRIDARVKIVAALNERERLRAATQKFVDAYTGKEHQLGNGQARRSFDEFRAALNEQKGE